MAERLSRKQKFQVLRDDIEKEALATQVETKKPIKLSRVQSNNLSHANKPTYPHEDIVSTKEASTNQVMDELLGEVKQYNISNGNRYTDDTQINILKQLDSSSPSSRTQHIMPMEEDIEEDLGSTMEMPRTNSFATGINVDTYQPGQKLTRMNPVQAEPEEEDEPDIFDGFSAKQETAELSFDDFFGAQDDKLVLNSNDIRADDLGDTDHLDLFEPGKFSGNIEGIDINEAEEEQEDPRALRKKEKKAKKAKKAKKKKAKKPVIEEEPEEVEMPSAKMRMQTEEVEETENEKPSKSGMILNVILVLLIIALIASIGFTVYFLYQMGK